jgi:hypothetical protein
VKRSSPSTSPASPVALTAASSGASNRVVTKMPKEDRDDIEEFQIRFIQGGGAGAHDEWDDKLFENLRRELGDGHEVRYPRMPDEDVPSYARWNPVIRREMADSDDGAVVIGNPVGATILINAAAGAEAWSERAHRRSVRRPGRLAGDEFELPATSARSSRRACGCMCSADSGTRPSHRRMPTSMPA